MLLTQARCGRRKHHILPDVRRHSAFHSRMSCLAALDMTRASQSPLWYLIWDPTQPVATRPLAIRTAGTWYIYGRDLIRLRVSLRSLATPRQAKNICEVYGPNGNIRTIYVYSPTNGRWTRRDPIGIEGGVNLYGCANAPLSYTDMLGMVLSAKDYIEKFKDFPHCGKNYCETIGEFFDHLAHDSGCNSLQDFANILGGGDADSLANVVAVGLGKILNVKSSISTKLFRLGS